MNMKPLSFSEEKRTDVVYDIWVGRWEETVSGVCLRTRMHMKVRRFGYTVRKKQALSTPSAFALSSQKHTHCQNSRAPSPRPYHTRAHHLVQYTSQGALLDSLLLEEREIPR